MASTINLDIPASAAERAARSVLQQLLGSYRVGDLNFEQVYEAIMDWHKAASPTLSVLTTEENYLIKHIDAECGIMAGDIEGSFHRIRETIAVQLRSEDPSVSCVEIEPLEQIAAIVLDAMNDAHDPDIYGTSYAQRFDKHRAEKAATQIGALSAPPAVSSAAREALEAALPLIEIGLKSEIARFEAMHRPQDHSIGAWIGQDRVRKIWADVNAALSLPAAGGEASKREAEIIERCAKAAEAADRPGSKWMALCQTMAPSEAMRRVIVDDIRALAVVPEDAKGGGARS